VILVDTSVWIDHLRFGDPHLAELLDRDVVASHDFVIGEIACGNLKNRQEVLSLLSWLPKQKANA
jgi:predicted nucleic acid-binding protein